MGGSFFWRAFGRHLYDTMSCPGSLTHSDYGNPSTSKICPTGSVAVGVDLVYTAPTQSILGSNANKICASSNDCDAGYACENGQCVRNWKAGVVRGITGVHCADANELSLGKHTMHNVVKFDKTVSDGVPSSFACPAGQALTGGTVWAGPTEAERVQFACSEFAPGAAPGMESSKYPAELMPGSSAVAQQLSTRGTAPSVSFANGMAVSHSETGVTGLGFPCDDFEQEFKSSDKRKLACCNGTADRPTLCGEYNPQSPACDSFMSKFCSSDCGTGGCLHAECGCVGATVGQPQCYDARCADQPAAYRTTQMAAQSDNCPTTANCNIWQLLSNGANLAKGITAPSNCVPTVKENIFSNPLVIMAIVVFIVLVFIAITRGSARSSRHQPIFAPPPPSDMFP